MDKDQYDALVDTLSKRIETTVITRFDLLQKTLETTLKTMDNNFANMDEDRKNIAEWKVKLATVEALLQQLLEIYTKQTKTITDKITVQTDIAIDRAVGKVTDNVEPAMNRAITKIKQGIPLNKEPIWRFWKRG